MGCVIDLKARAQQAMVDAGFHPDFSPALLQELERLKRNPSLDSAVEVRDLRSLP